MGMWRPRRQHGQRPWGGKALHVLQVGLGEVGGSEAQEGVDTMGWGGGDRSHGP